MPLIIPAVSESARTPQAWGWLTPGLNYDLNMIQDLSTYATLATQAWKTSERRAAFQCAIVNKRILRTVKSLLWARDTGEKNANIDVYILPTERSHGAVLQI